MISRLILPQTVLTTNFYRSLEKYDLGKDKGKQKDKNVNHSTVMLSECEIPLKY